MSGTAVRNSDSRAPLLGQMGTTITCCGVEATLHVAPEGTITYSPVQPRSAMRRCFGLCVDQPQHLKQQISGWHVVGAALESPNSFRIWYFQPPAHITSTNTAAPRFKLCKTPPYVCSSGSEAVALVQQVRQTAAWRGQEKPPRVVAVINPSSGQGKSQRLFRQRVAQVLEDAAGMSLISVATTHPGHATQIMQDLDLGTVDIVVFVGGDGTVFEGLQGLLSRPDWEAARRLPLAHVPGGSGNGLAHSCGLRDPATAAFAICKGIASPMDVASVLQPPSRRLYIMLLATYGMMSNLDVGTESLRWMGDTRFTLGALWEIAKNRAYHAGIAWLPPEPDSQQAGQTAAAHGSCSTSNGTADSSSSSSSIRVQSPSGPHETAAAVSDGQEQEQGRYVSIQDFPPGPDLPLLQQLGRLPLNVPQQTTSTAASSHRSRLPPGWQVMHEPLQMWSLINPPFIAASCKANPLGALHSGHMNMFCVKGLTGLRGRLQALDIQVKSTEGLHLDAPCLTQHKVRAMIFEARDSSTCLMLDGEVVPSAPIFLEVHQGLINVLINPAHPEEAAADHSREAASRSQTPV